MVNRTRKGLLGECSRVAVTGGSGFVGGHLVASLAREGKRVTVVDLEAPSQPPEVDVEFRRADLRDHHQVTQALAGAEMVFHLAGNSSGTLSVDRPRFDFEANALSTFNVAETAASLGVTRLVYLSSAMVYGRPLAVPISEDHPLRPFLPYASSKLSGELAIEGLRQSHGLPAVAARAFVIYGPGEDPGRAGGEASQYMRWHLNGLPVRAVGDLDRKTRDFVHVEDLVEGLLVVADRADDGEVFNLGSGRETSLRTLLRAIADATGRQPGVDLDPSVTEDSYRLVADIDKARALGFEPRVTLEEGLFALAEYLGERPELPRVPTVFKAKHDGQGRTEAKEAV